MCGQRMDSPFCSGLAPAERSGLIHFIAGIFG
jgi:hypothetical protein